MNLFGSSRRAEEFALAVSGQGPPVDPSVASLVAVADRLRETVTDPSPAFRLDLRERLMTAAETELAPAHTIPEQRRPVSAQPSKTSSTRGQTPLRRRLGTLAGAAIVAGSSVSLVAASANTLPGELLYPVKRASEDVELLLRTDRASEGHLQLEHAETRLDEVDALIRSDEVGSTTNTALVSATLEDFTSQAQGGADDLIAAFEQDKNSSGAIDELNDFTLDAAEQLRALAGVVPSGAGPEFADAAQAVVQLAERTSAVCRSCAGVVDEPVLDALTDSVEDVVLVDDERVLTMGGAPETSTDPVGTTGRDKPGEKPAQQPDEPVQNNEGPGANPDEPATQPGGPTPPDVPPGPGDGGDDPVDPEPEVPNRPDSPEGPDSPDVPELPDQDVPAMIDNPLGPGSNHEDETPVDPLDPLELPEDLLDPELP